MINWLLTMQINELSVIIPSYNAAEWLPDTLKKILVALSNSKVAPEKTEIIVIDDGSSDNTKLVIKNIAKESKVAVRYHSQKNQGRYITRKNGVLAARYDFIWFIDTRVHADPGALSYVQSELKKDKTAVIWNAHVNVHKRGNIIARFMDAITCIGWRAYFRNPRRTSYGLKEFDRYPKGTTSFLAPAKAIVSAIAEFDKESRDLKVSSDDTHLIRIMARDHQINLSPEFSCTYYARTTLRAFVKHSHHRGQVFVDGFYRRGTRFFVPINIFLLLTIGVVTVIIAYPGLLPVLVVSGITLWLLEFFIALLLGIELKDAASLVVLSPVFAVCYGFGIWKAVLRLGKKQLMSEVS